LYYILSTLLFFEASAQNVVFGPPLIVQNDFSFPSGIAIDQTSGNILVTNTGHQRISYVNIDSIQENPIWSEFGYVPDRTFRESLNLPQGIAVDRNKNVYIANTGVKSFNDDVLLFRWDNNNQIYWYDGNFRPAKCGVKFPRDIAVSRSGKIYLLDSSNDRILVAEGADDTEWRVWQSNPEWGNPYGIDISQDGKVFIADTGNHRVIWVKEDGTEQTFGSYGKGLTQFRFPRDVAIGKDGKIYVADTYNHRIVVLNPNGSHYRTLGSPGLFGRIEKITVDNRNRIFVTDSEKNYIVAYLGSSEPLTFDAYIRDNVNDVGQEPFEGNSDINSPDIIIRRNPDIDIWEARERGLDNYESEEPVYDWNNYVYLAVHNRGDIPISGVIAKFYYAYSQNNLLFPSELWRTEGLYKHYDNQQNNRSSNSLAVPVIFPPNQDYSNGKVVIGPLIWRPTLSNNPSNSPDCIFLARLFHPEDMAETLLEGTQANLIIRLSNNIASRRANVVHAAPKIEVEPLELDFGEIMAGDTSLKVIKVSNVGTKKLVINSCRLTELEVFSSHYSVELCGDLPLEIEPGDECDVMLKFHPKEIGSLSNSVLITSNDSETPEILVSVNGNSIASTEISCYISNTDIDFGNVRVGQTATRFIQIRNLGTTPLRASFNDIIFLRAFRIKCEGRFPNLCKTFSPILGTNEMCRIIIEFSPDVADTFSGTFKLSIMNDNTARDINISGKGLNYH
jgi:DNA-binding beta-propeller fold protein YncE